MITLYDYPQCPYCQKVRIVLAEKDLSYETILVDLGKGEQKNPEFLRLNPYGKVPVLRDEDEVLYDSTIINEYLEDEYPHPPLMPSDSASRARVRLWEDYCDNSFIPPMGVLLAQFRKEEHERDQERIRRSQEEILTCLERLEKGLESAYLVGSFSLADVAFAPRIILLPQLGIEPNGQFPRVVTWREKLRQRPSVRNLGLA